MKPLIVDNTFVHGVVEDHSDMLFRIAYHNVKSKSDAEDLVQEVFLQLIRKMDRFENHEHLKAWLIRATINKCKDHVKSVWFKRVIPFSTQAHDKKDPHPQGDDPVMEEIWSLPAKDRTVIFL